MTKLNFLTICCCLLATTFYAQKLDFSTFLISDDLKENANAVVRIDNMSINMTAQDEMTIITEMAVTVFNKKANYQSDISIPFDKNTSLKSFRGYVYDAMGNEIEKIKKSDFDEYSASGSSLYSDNKFYNFDYTPTTYPYTIYYKYEVKTSNTAFITRWYSVGSYYQSVQNTQFDFWWPVGIDLKKSENNLEDFDVKVVEEKNHISYSTSNIKAIEYEPYAPEFVNIAANVKLGVNKFSLEGVEGEANDWAEYGTWYYDNLIQPTTFLSESTKAKIKALTSQTDDPKEKAKIVYKFVQDKVRYISIQVGIGGFKPMNASDVDNLSYGDCKGLTNYTYALLKEAGVDSYHALIYGNHSRKKSIDTDVVAQQGNHMVLYVPIDDQELWLECTSQEVPFAEPGDFTDNRDAVILKHSGGEVKHTKVYDPRENLQKITGNYGVASNGNIEAEVEVIFKGTQFDTHLRYENSNNKDKEKLFKEFWDNIDNMTLQSFHLKNNKKDGQFEENVEFTATNYGTISGDRMIIPLNAFNVISRAPKRVRNRKLPVEVSNGFYDVDEVNIKLPSDYTIEAIADDVSIDTKYGSYTMTVEKIDESNLKFTRKFLLKPGDYPKEEYDAYRNFRRKVVKGDKSKIVLVKK